MEGNLYMKFNYMVMLTTVCAVSLHTVVMAAVTSPYTLGIWDDMRLSSFCLIGSLCGALLSISIAPPLDNTTEEHKFKRICFKFASQMACGVLFGPSVVNYAADYFNKTAITSDFIVAVSGFVSIFGVTLLHKVFIVLEKNYIFNKIIDKLFK